MSTSSTARQQPREPVTALVLVEHDRRLSTPHLEVWWARSDSSPDKDFRHRVTYDPTTKRWACDADTCPGWRHQGRCHHVSRCRRRRAVQVYYTRWSCLPPDALREVRGTYRTLEAAGLLLGEDALCALDALALLIGPEEAVAA